MLRVSESSDRHVMVDILAVKVRVGASPIWIHHVLSLSLGECPERRQLLIGLRGIHSGDTSVSTSAGVCERPRCSTRSDSIAADRVSPDRNLEYETMQPLVRCADLLCFLIVTAV